MQPQRSTWPRDESVDHHWDWRPEWREDRPCLYWYVTFDQNAMADAVPHKAVEAVRSTPWLDPVPLEWLHLTLCDLGFVDEVPEQVVDRAIRSLAECEPSIELPALTLGPLTSMESAVVVVVEPLEELRGLQHQLRSLTEAALGPDKEVVHQETFWPHVSLGYVNRFVSGQEVRALTEGFDDLRGDLPTGELVLAAVTRQRRHYQWTVRAELSTLTRGGRC